MQPGMAQSLGHAHVTPTAMAPAGSILERGWEPLCFPRQGWAPSAALWLEPARFPCGLCLHGLGQPAASCYAGMQKAGQGGPPAGAGMFAPGLAALGSKGKPAAEAGALSCLPWAHPSCLP